MNRATVNCARLVAFDVDSCGSVLHQVDKVLEKPTKTLFEQLEKTAKYSKFLKLIQEANLTDLIMDAEKDFTLLVPSDEVFAEQEDWYQQLLENPDQLERIIKTHILPGKLSIEFLELLIMNFCNSFQMFSAALESFLLSGPLFEPSRQ